MAESYKTTVVLTKALRHDVDALLAIDKLSFRALVEKLLDEHCAARQAEISAYYSALESIRQKSQFVAE